MRSYNPVERGRPAIWIDQPIQSTWQAMFLSRQLREYPDDAGAVDLVIAGGGGKIGVAWEMYTLLREDPRRIRVTIFDAPSASSLVAMAGDHIRIVEGGTIFLHGAGLSEGAILANDVARHYPAVALRLLARECAASDALMNDIIARRRGIPRDAIAKLRAAETTLDAAQAVANGFADEIVALGGEP